MQRLIALAAVVATLGLAGCGDTDLQRGATGAAIGAVAADLTGNNVAMGAAIGAAAGATCSRTTPQYCR